MKLGDLLPVAASVVRRIGPVRFEDPTRTEPVSRLFGCDRGTPIDRRYIERFLEANRAHIRGRVIEIAEARYSRRFASSEASFDVLHVEGGHDATTLVGDLTKLETLPEGTYDCFVCTQVFNFIFDVAAAMRGACHLLRPGGVLLATVAGLTPISRYDMDRWGDFWRFTSLSAERLALAHFSEVRVQTFGNALAARAFVDGLAVEDLPSTALLDVADPDYQITIGIVARK